MSARAAGAVLATPAAPIPVDGRYEHGASRSEHACENVVNIVIVDRQPLWRLALSACLSRRSHYSIVGETGLGAEAVRIAARMRPALLTLDPQLPDARWDNVLHDIRLSSPSTAIVVVTACQGGAVANGCFEAGAMGYVVKDADEADILQAAEHALTGRTWCSPQVGAHAMEALAARVATASTFSPRELAILEHLANGSTNAEIASALYLSKFTVQNYVSQIYGKIGLSNRCRVAELARAIVASCRQQSPHDSERRTCAVISPDSVRADPPRIRRLLDDRADSMLRSYATRSHSARP